MMNALEDWIQVENRQFLVKAKNNQWVEATDFVLDCFKGVISQFNINDIILSLVDKNSVHKVAACLSLLDISSNRANLFDSIF